MVKIELNKYENLATSVVWSCWLNTTRKEEIEKDQNVYIGGIQRLMSKRNVQPREWENGES